MKLVLNGDFYFFSCPHCKEEIIVNKNELNCKIFRHAIYKHNFEQVNPHLPYNQCKELLDNDKVFGCCKPFRIIGQDNNLFTEICDYI